MGELANVSKQHSIGQSDQMQTLFIITIISAETKKVKTRGAVQSSGREKLRIAKQVEHMILHSVYCVCRVKTKRGSQTGDEGGSRRSEVSRGR